MSRNDEHQQAEGSPYHHHAHPSDTGSGGLDVPNNSTAISRSLSPSSAVSAETLSHSIGSSRANSLPRPTSPSPSVASEKTEVDLQEKQEREEEERKRKIQLYVFISRCIAYPFNAKQPTDMTRRQTKITKHQLETISARFQVKKLTLVTCNYLNIIYVVELLKRRNANNGRRSFSKCSTKLLRCVLKIGTGY